MMVSSLYSVRLMRWSVRRPAGSCRCGCGPSGRRCRSGPCAWLLPLAARSLRPFLDARLQHRAPLALLLCWLRPSWHSATMPVGYAHAHGRIRFVDVLAAGAAGAEGVDAQVGRVQRDSGGRVGLGHHGHGAGAGVDAPLGFGGIRHALHAVAARFKAQRRRRCRRPRAAPPPL